MIDLSIEEINNFLDEYKQKISVKTKEKTEETLNKKLDSYFEKKSVLGFDIYRYSQYPTIQQTLIPHLFKELYNLTVRNCLKHESYIFQSKTEKDFTEYFIDGDGGFQIFDTPLHAVIFAIYFQSNITRYNSGKSFTATLREIIGEITLRYALTYDNIYSYKSNYYGPSIINNARIMVKDRLNRFLVDGPTITWFSMYFNGIENLQIITYKEDFQNISFFKNYEVNEEITEPTVLFDNNKAKILKVDLLKIGEMKSKLDTLQIHSLHFQILMYAADTKFKKYTISLGNLNSSGITD